MVTGKNGSGQKQQQRPVAKEVVIEFKCQVCYRMFNRMEELDEHENQCDSSCVDEMKIHDERIWVKKHSVPPNVIRSSPNQVV